MPKLLLATNNKGKVREYKNLLLDLDYQLVTLAEAGITTSVEESGKTMEENARLKATAFAAESNLLSMADDSGLEVDILGGEPGLFSARYAGEGASDAERINYLLVKLKDIPREKRSAQFRCVIAIAIPKGEVRICTGICRGFITSDPRGSRGFGYDPIFYFPEYDRTMAELPLALKNRVSHRARAAEQARQVLEELHDRAF
ncbi:MAG: XTP/dITP diphosphatase [Dehalococcoidales bacterium]|nr:XTP/dITP diphosphatase [Dehalococcoidales bacterium]